MNIKENLPVLMTRKEKAAQDALISDLQDRLKKTEDKLESLRLSTDGAGNTLQELKDDIEHARSIAIASRAEVAAKIADCDTLILLLYQTIGTYLNIRKEKS